MKCSKCDNSSLKAIPYTYSSRNIPILLILLDVINASIAIFMLLIIIAGSSGGETFIQDLFLPGYKGNSSFKEITEFFESFIKYYILIQAREIIFAPFVSLAIINFVILLIPYKVETTILFVCEECGETKNTNKKEESN